VKRERILLKAVLVAIFGTNGLCEINDPAAPQFSSRYYRTIISY